MASDAPAVPAVPAAAPAQPKRRGSYNCGRCGLPKKGHVCSVPGPAAGGGDKATGETQPPPPPPPTQQQQTKPRRALQFDDPASTALASPSPSPSPVLVLHAVPLSVAAPPAGKKKKARVEVVDVEDPSAGGDGDVDDDDDDGAPLPERWVEVGAGRRAPGEVLVAVLQRLSPRGVAAAAGVSRGWRACARRVWRCAEEVRLRAAGVGPVGALMARCPALARLVLTMER